MARETIAVLHHSFITIATLCLSFASSGCGGGEAAPRPGARAKGREGDPELSHHWQMPADRSVLESGDLGSTPPTLADAMMADGGGPGIGHRVAKACAEKGSLAGTATVALRFTIGDDGKLGSLEPDPAGAGATCIADAFRAEMDKAGILPAGAALMLLRFHAAAPR